MITCPYCKAEIEADSKFCDQCGNELKYCPSCNVPRRGTECPRCGEELITAKAFLSRNSDTSPQKTVHPTIMADMPQASHLSPSPQPAPQGTIVSQTQAPALSIVGSSWCLPVKEGRFGRNGGIYPEFSTVQYISGNHGQFRLQNAAWEVLDLGSTNGTYLNGQRLVQGKWYPVKKGDTLKIATIQFEIR